MGEDTHALCVGTHTRRFGDAVEPDAAQQADITRDLCIAFKVNILVRLQDQVSTGAQQVDIAANNDVVLAAYRETLIGVKRCYGSGEQEAITTLPQQLRSLLQLEALHCTVVVFVLCVDNILLGATGDQPTIFLASRETGIRVMQAFGESSHHRLLSFGGIRVGFEISLGRTPTHTHLVEDTELLFRSQNGFTGILFRLCQGT